MTMDKETEIRALARLCHEMNRAWCALHGDESQVPWEHAPSWQQDSAIAGVRAQIAAPGLTPREQHETWMEYKLAEGWTYGAVKDPDAKTHPCLVPYEDLPFVQRTKDALFVAIVRSFYGEAPTQEREDT